MTQEELEELIENKLFINLNDDIGQIYLGQIIKANIDSIEVIWTSPTNGVHPGMKKYTLDEFSKTLLPFLHVDRQDRKFKIAKYEHLRIKCKKWFQVDNAIYHNPQHRVTINNCIFLIQSKLKVSLPDANAILKLNIARGKLHYIKNSKGEFVRLSPDILMFENRKRYLSSLSAEIESQSRRIEYVIGHGQTIGNYREKLFMSVLKKYIPTKFHIATGFIDGVNKQIDILIYDQHNYLPIFREDDLVVVKAESVVAAIEIKSTLDQKSLKNALEGISIISDKLTSIPYFKGIFAFKSSFKNNQALAKSIINYYNANEIDSVFNHFDVICVPERHCFRTIYNEASLNNYCPSLRSLSGSKEINIEESYFFQQLFTYLQIDQNPKKINNMFFQELSRTADTSDWGYLTDESWFPMNTFMSEYDTITHLDLDTEFDEIQKITKSNVLIRVRTIDSWRNGNISTEEVTKLFNNDY